MSAKDPSRDRGPIAFAALLGAVALVVGAKSASGSATHSTAALTGTGSTTDPAPTAPPPSGSPPSGSAGSTAGTRTATGAEEDTRYGPVQVRLTLSGSKITDVVAIQLPSAERRDEEINSYAVPQLRQEVLDAQSARIDSISGASFTSEGYARSVQSALDRAGG